MSDHPQRPEGPDDDPFANLPPELRQMLEQLGGPGALEQAQQQLQAMLGGSLPGFGFQPPAAPTGPVDWQLATRIALQLAAEDDRSATDAEARAVRDAFDLAEHWLDDTPLPAPPDAGIVVPGSRQTWVNAAVKSLAPLVEPVARAATDAMVDMAREQLGELGEHGGLDALPGLEDLPEAF